jgi:hypothetical protein
MDTPAGMKKSMGAVSMNDVFLQLARKATRTEN